MNPLIRRLVIVQLMMLPHAFTSEHDHHRESPICTHRYEYRNIKALQPATCDDVRAINRMCRQDVTIAFEQHPPYVFQEEDGEITGILVGMLQAALESCCNGCNKLTFVGPLNSTEGLLSTRNVSLAIPIQTASSAKEFFDHDFVYLYPVQSVSFFVPNQPHDRKKMTEKLFSNIMGTWPLFVVAFLMALAAGLVVWLLDNWSNDEDFPQAFPQGPLEGFWWAFVSMTTVGYGDKAPKSAIARLFAVLWILLGITIFSMYTASLTSALTSSAVASENQPVYRKKFGVLRDTSASYLAAVMENAIPKKFNTIEEIQGAIKSGFVEGIVMDDNIANYYLHHLQEDQAGSSKLKIVHRTKLNDISYGLLSYNKNVTTFFKSFMESNADYRLVMAHDAMQDHAHDAEISSLAATGDGVFFTHKSDMYQVTIFSLLGVVTIVSIIGVILQWFCNRKINILKYFKDVSNGKKRPLHSSDLYAESTYVSSV